MRPSSNLIAITPYLFSIAPYPEWFDMWMIVANKEPEINDQKVNQFVGSFPIQGAYEQY